MPDSTILKISPQYLTNLFKSDRDLATRFYWRCAEKLASRLLYHDPSQPSEGRLSLTKDIVINTNQEGNINVISTEFGIEDNIIKEFKVRRGVLYLCNNCICSSYFHIFFKKIIINISDIINILSNENTREIVIIKEKKKKYKFNIIDEKDFQMVLVILSSYGLKVVSETEENGNESDEEVDDLHLDDEDWRLILCGNNFLLTYKANQPIIEQGQELDKLFVISRGSALAKFHFGEKEYKLGIMEQGEMIGDLSFLVGKPASCTVVANEDEVQIFSVDRGYLRYLFYSYPVLASKFLKFICLIIGQRIYLRESEGTTFSTREGTLTPKILRKLDSGRYLKKKSRSNSEMSEVSTS